MNKITIPTISQIYEEEQLEIFEKYGTKAVISDFAIILGGIVSDWCIDDFNSLDKRTGCWWTQTPFNDTQISIVDWDGTSKWNDTRLRTTGIRPSLELPTDLDSSVHKVIINGKELLEVEYGEYPQKAVNKNLQIELEELFNKNKLISTGKTYTTDSRNYNEYNREFLPLNHIEYEYQGKKYVRVKVNGRGDSSLVTLSNGEKYHEGDYVWVEVSPLKWLVDKNKKNMICKDIVVAGIQFNKDKNCDLTGINKFLNEIFYKDITEQKRELKHSSIFARLFKPKKNKDVKTLGAVKNFEENDVLAKLMEEIEYKLSTLEQVNKIDYDKYYKEYQKFTQSDTSILESRQACIAILSSLAGKIEASLSFNKKNSNNIEEYLDSLKTEYLDNFLNNRDSKTVITLEELDKMTETFLKNRQDYNIVSQRNILKKLSFIYLMEVRENIDNIKIDDLNNSYFKYNLKSIILILCALQKEGIIKENFEIDFNQEVTVQNILNIIRKMEFNIIEEEKAENFIVRI